MKTIIRKVMGTLTAMVFSIGCMANPTSAVGSERVLMREYFGSAEKWEGSETGVVTEVDSKSYTTNAAGYNQVEIPGITKADAKFSVKFHAFEWSADTTAFVGVAIRMSGKAGYRVAYYPAQRKLKLEQTDAQGKATVLDETAMVLNTDSDNVFTISAKDSMIRGELDGVVWLMENTAAAGTAGSAAIVSNLQTVIATEPQLTGEDRLYWDTFESGRLFDSYHNWYSGTLSTSGGKLKLKGSFSFGVSKIADSNYYEKKSKAWEQTELSFDMAETPGKDASNVELPLYGINVKTNIDSSYVAYGFEFLLKPVVAESHIRTYSGSTATGKTQNAANTTVLTKDTVNNYKVLSKLYLGSEAAPIYHRDLTYWLNGVETLTVTKNGNAQGVNVGSPTNFLTGGGYYLGGAATNTCSIDNLLVRDISATETTATVLYGSSVDFTNWTDSGDVQGMVTSSGSVYHASAGQNGILLLNNASWKNVALSADVAPLYSEGSYTALYMRYFDDNNYVKLTYDGAVMKIIQKADGAETEKASVDYAMSSPSFRIELRSYEGIYIGSIDGDIVAQTEVNYNANKGYGTIGLQAYGCAADFDNVSVKENNYVWYVGNRENKTVNETLTQMSKKGSNDVMFTARAVINNANFGTISMMLRHENMYDYNPFYFTFQYDWATSLTMRDNLWSSVTEPDASHLKYTREGFESTLLKIGEINEFSVEMKENDNQSVTFTRYINGTKVGTDAVSNLGEVGRCGMAQYAIQLTPGANLRFIDSYVTDLNKQDRVGKLNTEFKFSPDELAGDSSISLSLAVENLSDADFADDGMVVMMAIYDGNGALVSVQPIESSRRVKLGETMVLTTPEFTLPGDVSGYTAKAYCMNSLANIKPLLGTLSIPQ